MNAAPTLGLILPPDQAPERFLTIARAADAAGVDELWLWEDCFGQSGTSTAAAVLAATERIRVGLGLMPVPLRNVALTAMEIATMGRMFPGRFLPGIGHGVLEWMAQAGVRAASPLTLLTEQATALRMLLAGDELSVDGRYVQLDRVQLRWPAAEVPPLLIGGGKPKTLALAGELGDGVILAGDMAPGAGVDVTRAAVATVLEARAAAGLEGPYAVVQFAGVRSDASADEVTRLAADYAAVGATSVPLLPLDADGEPETGDGILRLAETIGGIARGTRA
ncbi:LLM class flavin-dependent oxidoreductase [Agrococcus sp. ARC_14]|uniref:LLM class flavin-dependent oxidoreductase n=1 Tax=Agrococcus sp. ARC_14 TaxID=2919927 RepID=UPI001F0632C7|nr:LLM class flavin-dependent oxidoreductase [Agrococcus sp. ARC_14]MCH1882973.1 LLM class flavin-dependent oxidoreductase [Agrococcus sp. ARC_14]